MNPEIVVHGTASEKDAKGIENEGFRTEEGRATVSADLAYAFEWATKSEKRVGSKSASEVGDEEVGRIVLMRVPEGMTAAHSTHTDIEVDENLREISGYVKKFISGDKQLGLYVGDEPDKTRKDLEQHKKKQDETEKKLLMYLESKGIDLGALGKAENKKEELGIQIREMGLSVNEQIDIYTAAENMDIILAEEKKRAEKEILISRENILLSIFPSKELGTVLDSLRESIKNMQTFNLENIAEGIVDIIKNDGKTQIQEGLSDEDLSAILIQLLRDTVKTEVRNFIRNFEIQTKKAVGYKVMARDKQSELETTELTKEELTEKIETILGNFESGFTTGDKSLDEGVLSSLKQQSKELSSNN